MRSLSQDNADLDDMIAFGRKFFAKMDKLYLDGTFDAAAAVDWFDIP